MKKTWYLPLLQAISLYRGRLKFLPGGRLPVSQSQTIHLWSKLIWPYHTLTTKLLGLIDGGRLALRGLFHYLFLNPNNTPSPLAAKLELRGNNIKCFFWCLWCHQRIPRQTSRSYYRLYWTAVGAHMVNFRIFLNLKSNNPNNPKSTLVMSGDSGYLPILCVFFKP